MRVIFFLLLTVALWGKPLKVDVSAKSAVLMNAETGAILYEKKGDIRAYPASLTKIATCLYAIKENKKELTALVSCPSHCLRKMNKSVKIAHGYKDPAYFLEPDGLHFSLKRGEKIPFVDLLYGAILASGNDATNVIAHYIGGSIPKFMEGMNGYLKKIGCEDTLFLNPHGLHHPQHRSTARDMALITREALKNDLMRTVASTREYERSQTNLQMPKKIANRNPLMVPGKFFYPRAIGMKTGYHCDAGYTYAGVARDGKRTLIAILLGCSDPHQRLRDAIRLFETAFDEEKESRLLFKKEENIFTREIKRGKGPLKATLTDDVSIAYFPSEEPKLTIELNWEHMRPPVKQGSYVGEIRIFDQVGNMLSSAPLVATAPVERSFLALLADAVRGNEVCFKEFQKALILLLGVGILFTLFILYRIQCKEEV